MTACIEATVMCLILGGILGSIMTLHLQKQPKKVPVKTKDDDK